MYGTLIRRCLYNMKRVFIMNNNENVKVNNICIYDRKKAELTGISDVVGFTDTTVVATCKSGNISIEGSDLKIESFDSGTGNLSVSGTVNGLFYYGGTETQKKKQRKFFG